MTGRLRPPVPAAAAAAAFAPHTLALARRWRRMRKNELARQIGVTAAAVSQYELGQARPSAAVLARLALALSMPVDFFAAGFPPPVTPGQAHFRSLRTTSQAERDQAESFGEIAWRVVEVTERHLRLPRLRLPQLDLAEPAGPDDVRVAATTARESYGLGAAPVPHMVRLLEASGVIVLALPDVSERVDAFSHWYGQRPFVFLNPAKDDKARSRMDAAHELGHLLMHHDAEPGSQLLERQATAFASEFLAPSAVLRDELPARLDFDRLHELKRRWGVSLKALVYRGHDLGVYREHTYRRGMGLLAQWGYPEPGDLGPREAPSLLGKAVELLDQQQVTIESLATSAALPLGLAHTVVAAATERVPELDLTAG
ncbi:XRE family transcriptional regulator [Plantactinospora soyae]|uniref:Zn-dependent peptidase ImmA (M78 family)/DNA-binding XRE family transcriptional regulator n=1 Tax=Plantactinospora soyae TaxID=1544732 RepID=A0A927M702_9ACTN|nr:XRE family transcriptional regulator [Plantactinospora soyae]MBE1487886.1 Zn-dependent peptidase ImmA (M78 family)/DNA-binding XRE family transcriptional regulator [Plantactinospora soyae]